MAGGGRGLLTDRFSVTGRFFPQRFHRTTKDPAAPRATGVVWSVGIALSALGYLMTIGLIWWGFTSGPFVPGGEALLWDRVGDEVRAGVSPYYQPGAGGFYYAPPWAIIFAATSWLSPIVVWLALGVLEAVALWYIAGSVKRMGWCMLWPLVAFELPSGQINLLLAAAIAAAIRGDGRAGVVMAFAKLSPILAVMPSRRTVYLALGLVAVTLPWWWLWPEWVAQLSRNAGATIAPSQIPIPLLPRLAVAGGLLLLRQPWARGLAAIVAIPAPYWVSSVLFLGLLPAWRQPMIPTAHARAAATVNA